MKYQSHIVIAAAATTAFHPWSEGGIVTVVACYFFSILGGLLPDIDHPHSFFGSKIPLLPTILYRFDGHRGVTHSLFGLIWAAILGIVLVNLFIFGITLAANIVKLDVIYRELSSIQESRLLLASVGIGYLTHLLGDFITNKGIPIFWPIRTRYVLKVATTGSPLENLIVLYVIFIGLLIGFSGSILSYALRYIEKFKIY